MDGSQDDQLEIPDFLRRIVTKESDMKKSAPAVQADTTTVPVPPKAAKAAKAAPKAAKVAKAAPKAKTDRDQFGFKVGSLKNRAAKMCMSGKGATLEQIKEALNSPQYNFLTQVEAKGFVVETDQVKGSKDRMVTRYKIVTK